MPREISDFQLRNSFESVAYSGAIYGCATLLIVQWIGGLWWRWELPGPSIAGFIAGVMAAKRYGRNCIIEETKSADNPNQRS